MIFCAGQREREKYETDKYGWEASARKAAVTWGPPYVVILSASKYLAQTYTNCAELDSMLERDTHH